MIHTRGHREVDAAITPRVVGGNTNAPVAMIAEKASDLIKATLGGREAGHANRS